MNQIIKNLLINWLINYSWEPFFLETFPSPGTFPEYQALVPEPFPGTPIQSTPLKEHSFEMGMAIGIAMATYENHRKKYSNNYGEFWVIY